MRTFRIDPADRTVLMAADADAYGPMSEADIGIAKRGWLQGWTGPNDIIGWQISVPSAGQYELWALAAGGKALPTIQVAAGSSTLTARLPRTWERTLLGTARLPAGKSTITLRCVGPGVVERLLSLELVRPAVRTAIARRAARSRADTDWLVTGKYGLMFHWTSQTQPRHGRALPYQAAVDAFNVPRFVRMVGATGAAHVIFTTSHAGFWWPGPHPVIDKVMPGRTCRRDLIREIADGLGEHGIRLMLYYHPGHDDVPWWNQTGFDKPNKAAFFRQWQSIIEHAGRRYGPRLAGWWFDDATFTYYPTNPPWERLAASARKGNSQRLVCWNSWILPRVTDFADMSSWEAYLDMDLIRGRGQLPLRGDGRYIGGGQEGLQAHITTPATKGGWCHDKPNRPVGDPQYRTAELIGKLKEAARRKCAVTLNLEIYQDGTIGQASSEQMTEIRVALKDRKRRRST